jgi:hypothetical protein
VVHFALILENNALFRELGRRKEVVDFNVTRATL